MNDKIVLIGFMGSGKTSVGKYISENYGQYRYIDSDNEIEKIYSMTITQIFAERGEAAFRNMEKTFLKFLLKSEDKIVLSTGGGMPCNADNSELLKKLGLTVYLSCRPETIYERLKEDTSRPLLQVEDKFAKIEELLYKRDALYRNASKMIIETDDKTIEEIAKEILGN